MKLTEMLGQYEELLDKKDQLAKDTKDNNAAIKKPKVVKNASVDAADEEE